MQGQGQQGQGAPGAGGELLIRQADQALYAAKKAGRGRDAGAVRPGSDNSI